MSKTKDLSAQATLKTKYRKIAHLSYPEDIFQVGGNRGNFLPKYEYPYKYESIQSVGRESHPTLTPQRAHAYF